MSRVRLRCLVVVSLLTACSALAASNPAAGASGTSPAEVMTVAQLLAQVHYNRQSVEAGDSTRPIVEAMMRQVDPTCFVFEAGDLDALVHASQTRGVEAKQIRTKGSLATGQEIYGLYRRRWEERHQLIRTLLAGPLKVTGEYDAAHPATSWPTHGDELAWMKRLRSELNVASLDSGDDQSARLQLGKHYDALVTNIRAATPTEIDELYLQAYAKRYDRHTTYFSADTLADFSDAMHGVVGIGFGFKNVGEGCVTEDVIPGGPAAGQVYAYDRLVGVGARADALQDIAALPERAVARLTRGTPGSNVAIKVVPDGMAASPNPHVFNLARAPADPSVRRVRAAVFDVAAADGRSRLAAQNFHFEPILLPGEAPASAPAVPADPDRLDVARHDDFEQFDVSLREALRVLSDMATGTSG